MACRLAATGARGHLQALSALLDEHEKGGAPHAGRPIFRTKGTWTFTASPRQAKTRRLSLFFATSFII